MKNNSFSIVILLFTVNILLFIRCNENIKDNKIKDYISIDNSFNIDSIVKYDCATCHDGFKLKGIIELGNKLSSPYFVALLKQDTITFTNVKRHLTYNKLTNSQIEHLKRYIDNPEIP